MSDVLREITSMEFLAWSGLIHLDLTFYTTHSHSAQWVCGREDSFTASSQLHWSSTSPQAWDQVEASKVPGTKCKEALTPRFIMCRPTILLTLIPTLLLLRTVLGYCCWDLLEATIPRPPSPREPRYVWDWLASCLPFPPFSNHMFLFLDSSCPKTVFPPSKLPFMTSFQLTFPPKL